MPDFIIATASTADLPREYLDRHHIPFIRYGYTVNDLPREDDCREESRAEIYAGMRQGDLLKTSMINEYSYYEFFRNLLEQEKDVIYLDMSEKMSVSFENAKRAAETARAEFPERKLYVMDTRCVSGGLGLLVKRMVERYEAGESFDALVQWGEEHKLKIAHHFTVDDLNYLKRGGRVSNASALVGSLLSIKPVLYVPDAGTLDVVKKARGRRAALKAIVEGVTHDLSRVDATDAGFVRDAIRKACPQVGEVNISSLGVVIGAHTGPGLLAVFYLCGGRQPE